jgi:hypothetical protein
LDLGNSPLRSDNHIKGSRLYQGKIPTDI